MEKEQTPKSLDVKGKNRQLLYSAEFKEKVRNNQETFRIAAELISEMDNNESVAGTKLSIYDVNVELFEKPDRNTGAHTWIYKIESPQGKFMVKVDKNYPQLQGYLEAKASTLAQEQILKTIEKIPDVEIVKFYLGYTDKWNNNYFISEWLDLRDINTILYDSTISAEQKQSLSQRVDQIEEVLGDNFIDIDTINMFYDPENNKIILFDLMEAKYFPHG